MVRRDTNKLVSCFEQSRAKVLSNGHRIVVRVKLIPLSVGLECFIGIRLVVCLDNLLQLDAGSCSSRR